MAVAWPTVGLGFSSLGCVCSGFRFQCPAFRVLGFRVLGFRAWGSVKQVLIMVPNRGCWHLRGILGLLTDTYGVYYAIYV